MWSIGAKGHLSATTDTRSALAPMSVSSTAAMASGAATAPCLLGPSLLHKQSESARRVVAPGWRQPQCGQAHDILGEPVAITSMPPRTAPLPPTLATAAPTSSSVGTRKHLWKIFAFWFHWSRESRQQRIAAMAASAAAERLRLEARSLAVDLLTRPDMSYFHKAKRIVGTPHGRRHGEGGGSCRPTEAAAAVAKTSGARVVAVSAALGRHVAKVNMLLLVSVAVAWHAAARAATLQKGSFLTMGRAVVVAWRVFVRSRRSSRSWRLVLVAAQGRNSHGALRAAFLAWRLQSAIVHYGSQVEILRQQVVLSIEGGDSQISEWRERYWQSREQFRQFCIQNRNNVVQDSCARTVLNAWREAKSLCLNERALLRRADNAKLRVRRAVLRGVFAQWRTCCAKIAKERSRVVGAVDRNFFALEKTSLQCLQYQCFSRWQVGTLRQQVILSIEGSDSQISEWRERYSQLREQFRQSCIQNRSNVARDSSARTVLYAWREATSLCLNERALLRRADNAKVRVGQAVLRGVFAKWRTSCMSAKKAKERSRLVGALDRHFFDLEETSLQCLQYMCFSRWQVGILRQQVVLSIEGGDSQIAELRERYSQLREQFRQSCIQTRNNVARDSSARTVLYVWRKATSLCLNERALLRRAENAKVRVGQAVVRGAFAKWRTCCLSAKKAKERCRIVDTLDRNFFDLEATVVHAWRSWTQQRQLTERFDSQLRSERQRFEEATQQMLDSSAKVTVAKTNVIRKLSDLMVGQKEADMVGDLLRKAFETWISHMRSLRMAKLQQNLEVSCNWLVKVQEENAKLKTDKEDLETRLRKMFSNMDKVAETYKKEVTMKTELVSGLREANNRARGTLCSTASMHPGSFSLSRTMTNARTSARSRAGTTSVGPTGNAASSRDYSSDRGSGVASTSEGMGASTAEPIMDEIRQPQSRRVVSSFVRQTVKAVEEGIGQSQTHSSQRQRQPYEEQNDNHAQSRRSRSGGSTSPTLGGNDFSCVNLMEPLSTNDEAAPGERERRVFWSEREPSVLDGSLMSSVDPSRGESGDAKSEDFSPRSFEHARMGRRNLTASLMEVSLTPRRHGAAEDAVDRSGAVCRDSDPTCSDGQSERSSECRWSREIPKIVRTGK